MPRSRNGLLVGRGLLLGRVEAADHDHHRRPFDAGRLAQDAVERLALVGDLHPLARRVEVRQRRVAARHRLHVRGPHLLEVVHEQELGEVVVDAGALQMLARAQELAAGPAPPVPSPRARRRAPTTPGTSRPTTASDRGDLLEIGERHPVGDEARSPMGDRRRDARVSGHVLLPRQYCDFDGSYRVIPAPVAGIHLPLAPALVVGWMPRTSPGMTRIGRSVGGRAPG